MALRAIRHISLCAGYGGLDLGLKLALGEARLQTVCYVEREASAAATLVARMEDEMLDQAPVWDCLETFDGSAWRGAVDIVSAGFPCQPWSCAGRREGTGDARWLWPSVFRIIVDLGAPLAFLENVPGLVSGHGLEYVLSDLASAGFDAEWGHFTAAEVGASHRRARVFILAYASQFCQREPDTEACPQPRNDPWSVGCSGGGNMGNAANRGQERQASMADRAGERGKGQRVPTGRGPERKGTPNPDGADTPMADTEDADGRAGSTEFETTNECGWRGHCSDCRSVGNAERAGCRQVSGVESSAGWADSIELRGFPLFPPSPEDELAWAEVLRARPQLAPAPPQSVLRGVADGAPGRVDRVRMLGNGVVPLQAAYAFRALLSRIQST